MFRRISTVSHFGSSLKLHEIFEKSGRCIEHCDAILQQVKSPQNILDMEHTVDNLDTVSNNICSIVDLAEAAMRISNDFKVIKKAETSRLLISNYMSELNSDQRLYMSLKNCIDEDSERKFLDSEARSVGISLKKEYEMTGIHFPADLRVRFQRNQNDILESSLKFEQCINSTNYMKSLSHLWKLIRQRYEMAKMLNLPSYSHYILSDNVFDTSDHVLKFLHAISAGSEDESFYSIKKCTVKNEGGLLFWLKQIGQLCKEIFGLEIAISQENLWGGHQCYRLSFNNLNNSTDMGTVYVLRNNYGPPCHFPILTWRNQIGFNFPYNKNGHQKPICIVQVPLNGTSILSDQDVESLFHEFGHALHTITSDTKYHHLSGTRCKIEFAEVPSTIMEIIAKKYFGFATRKSGKEQVFLAQLDQFLHGQESQKWNSLEEFQNGLCDWTNSRIKGSLDDQEIIMRRISKFRHLATYGGVYFSYLFSARIASKIYSKFLDRSSTTFNPSLYVKKALAIGGTVHTRQILQDLEITI